MLHAMVQDNHTSGFGEQSLKFFTIYGFAGHLGRQ